MRVRYFLSYIFVFFLAGTNAVGQSRADTQIVRVSFVGTWEALPTIVAMERGFANQEGLVFSPVATPSVNAIFASLRSGGTDLAIVSQVQLLSQAQSSGARAIGVNSWGARHAILTKSGRLRSLAKLKGKRIAVLEGEDSIAVIVRALDAAGVSADKVTVEALSPAKFQRALDDGFDAMVGPEVVIKPLVEAGVGRIAVSGDSLGQSIGYVGATPIVASKYLIEQQPELAARILRTYSRAKAHAASDPEDAARLLRIYLHRRGMNLSLDEAKNWVSAQQYDLDGWQQNAVEDSQFNAWALSQMNVLGERPATQAYLSQR
jgi:ABC-type nitrate/sulfonate/bicarbonate transport system substrate-binding protein